MAKGLPQGWNVEMSWGMACSPRDEPALPVTQGGVLGTSTSLLPKRVGQHQRDPTQEGQPVLKRSPGLMRACVYWWGRGASFRKRKRVLSGTTDA